MFDPEKEGVDIERVIAQKSPVIKSCSLLPRDTKVYPLMPYEEITEEQYNMMVETMIKIDFTSFVDGSAGTSDGKKPVFCEGDRCEL